MKFANITHISPDKQKLGHTIMSILLSINFNIVLCAKNKRVIWTVLLSTHNVFLRFKTSIF